MPLPRTKTPHIYTLRSNDLPADEEKKEYEITAEITGINHSNMDNDANDEERKFMTQKIYEYIKN
ncbi:hypothetical protein [Chryseobacterium flavum]|uniref:hypothetical protein n=1 Tax=Chryseobacterium flavum TaxID=415851 RepID=UPI0028A7DD89|nr:hypothetical protein [Chryseobacterium flavum]